MPAPDFTLPDLEGKLKNLADFRGRVVVLNFWATWCPPCIDEMPSLERLHQAMADRGVAVIAVSVDERFSDVPAFVEKFDLTFSVLYDEGKKVSRKYQTFKYPETYILDREGRLKSKVVGPRDWAAPTVIRDMVDLLKEAPPSEGTSGEG
jgi:peroxiredoxin